MIVLDTSTCISLLRGDTKVENEFFRMVRPCDVGIVANIVAELLIAAEQSNHPAENKLVLHRFLSPLTALPYDASSAPYYAAIRSRLESIGITHGSNILIIAAVCLRHNARLITHTPHFYEKIEGLDLRVCEDVLDGSMIV